MIWAALIRVALGQDHALGLFRRILNFIGKHDRKDDMHDLMLTGISKLPADLRDELIRFIAEPPEVRRALGSLLLFEALPARDSWTAALSDSQPDVELLMAAVGATLWHQSQEATDCRWLRVMGQVVAGRFHIPSDMLKQWCGYPNEGDQREVRPSIRSSEIAPSSFETPDLTWPHAFWDEAWRRTPCLQLRKPKEDVPVEPVLTRGRVRELNDRLRAHWEATHSTTAIDARHDAVFGMAFYALAILDELMGIGVANSILGRLGLRTTLETRINLRFLLQQNDEGLWKKWRAFGAGQAKLTSLKFDETVETPKYIDLESLEQIANEDLWEEFVAINLAGWSGIDLRKMSEKAALKPTYDQYYVWTSGYAHGMWGPIRESCFRTCGNPLHRLHRYPETHSLPDVIGDAVELTDAIIADLDGVFPSFPFRLLENPVVTEKQEAA
ncbi:MAG: DUF5677 domain-containing protein [Terrimicrobiaceae bacterium]|nr:DUF5677 domain-containing protein [Terrimicrobiaceae bacterium]